jgi:hypothetical protein
MSNLLPLLALGLDALIPIIVAILFVALPAIGQMIAKGRQAQQQQQRPARPGGRKPQQGPLQDEIGEFLRRAAQQRGGRQPPQAAQGAQPAMPPRPAQQRPQPAKPQRPRKRPAERVVQAEVVEVRPMEPDRLAKQVTEDINTGTFDRRARELGENVARAESRVEERVHEVFDHKLGQLATKPTAPSQEQEEEQEGTAIPATAAAGLAAMLADHQGLRQAIVLNEILHRPEERWG